MPANWLPPVVPQVSAVNINYRALTAETGEAPTLIGGVLTPPNAGQLSTVRAIRAADVPAFHDFNLQTKRTRYDVGFAYNLNPQWAISSSFRHENKNGVKPLGAMNAFGAGGDSYVTLPELIDTRTNQINAALDYVGEKLHGQFAYYGSLFDNNVRGMTWQDPKNPAVSPTISSAPSNQFHEFNFTGGYNFTPTTKLVLHGAYGRNTQNEAFLTPPAFNLNSFTSPESSAHGLVITSTADVMLTTRPFSPWGIVANFKYNDRNNQTPVRQFIFYDGDVATNGPGTPSPFATLLGIPNLGQNANIYNNRPLSKTTYQFKFDNDYRIAMGHTLAAGYEFERTRRTCHGTWIDCSDADQTSEHTGKAEWRGEFGEDVSTRVAYARSHRSVNYNENAWLAEVPLAKQIGTGATISVYDFIRLNGLTGFGPLLGFPVVPLTGNAAVLIPGNNIILQRFYGSRNNISEIPGMRRYNLADRNRDQLRTSANWQATERLSLQAGVDFNRDGYANSVYGLTGARDLAVNLDGTYAIGENLTANLFYSFEDLRSSMASFPSNISNVNPATAVANNVLAGSPCFTTVQDHNGSAKIDPCNKWSANMRDTAHTIGLSLRKKKFLSEHLDVGSSILFTRAWSDIAVRGGTYVNNPLAGVAGEPGVFFIPAENLPRVTTNIISFGVNGEYRFTGSLAMRMAYSYKNLRASADYALDGLQFGTATGAMPTNEKVSRYSVNTVGMSLVYRFQ